MLCSSSATPQTQPDRPLSAHFRLGDAGANGGLPRFHRQRETAAPSPLPAGGSARAEIAIATIWLTQQVAPFIRYYETLSKPPLSLKIDKSFIEQLAADLGRMAIAEAQLPRPLAAGLILAARASIVMM